jgi:two-component system response regulator RegA
MNTAEQTSLLIVDDDERFRERLTRAMRLRGFEVRAAASVDEALAFARLEAPEFAIIDLRMPGPSGLELIVQLKQLDPNTRIVMLTGFGSIATAVDAMRLGADHYLQKPATPDELIAAFERITQPVLLPESQYEPQSLARVEWEHISRVLSDVGGNVSEAARRLGLHRRSLQRKLTKFAPK